MAFEEDRAIGCDERKAFKLFIGDKLIGHEVPVHVFFVVEHGTELVEDLILDRFSLSQGLDWVLDVSCRVTSVGAAAVPRGNGRDVVAVLIVGSFVGVGVPVCVIVGVPVCMVVGVPGG